MQVEHIGDGFYHLYRYIDQEKIYVLIDGSEISANDFRKNKGFKPEDLWHNGLMGILQCLAIKKLL